MSFTAAAQNNTNSAKSAELKAIFKDDKVAATHFHSAYAFQLQGEELNVIETDAIDMIALQGNVNYSREVYYDDNSAVLSGDFRYTKGKRIRSDKNCGNYEVDGIFYSDAKVCSWRVNFLREGTEITFSSSKRFSDPRYLTKVFLHDEIAVGKRTVTFEVPQNVNVDLVEKNFDGFDIKRETSQRGNAKIYSYTAEALEAVKHESNSLGMLHYYPHIVVVTKDYTTEQGTNRVIGSTADLYQWYSSIVKEVRNDASSFEDEVHRITADTKTVEDKIRAIYYWVQDNIKYIAFEDGLAGFRPESAQNVYHNRYGDCKGMANLTREMLKVAGIDARLAWIGTNRIPYNYDLPSLAVDNHMICAALVGDKEYILDPTEKFIALGKHGERIQGKQMMIEDGEGYLLRQVPLSQADENLVLRTEELALDGETLKGHGKVIIHGEATKDLLYLSTNIIEENRKKLFTALAVSDYKNTDKVELEGTPPIDREKALELAYNFGLGNKVTRFDNDLYIDIDWEKSFRNHKIAPDRLSDYYFNRKIRHRVTKKFTVPSGYRVSHLPKEIAKQHPDFSVTVKFEQKGSVLSYTNEIVVHHGLIRKSDFETWNAIIKELNGVYDDQIVLTRTAK